MNSSVVRRMYAGFSLIVILFITTVILMLNGTSNIHNQMKSVSSDSLPLVSLSNETSVSLLAADKSFKDFLTTRNAAQMQQSRAQFSAAEETFNATFTRLVNVAEENQTAMNDIANVSSTLNELAHQQSDIVHQFKV